MMSQQKNSTDLSKLRDLLDQYTDPTVKKKVNEIAGLKEFVMQGTQDFPEETKLVTRVKALATGNPCKCKNCGKTHGKLAGKFCSAECRNDFNEEYNKEQQIKRAIKRADDTFKDSTENVHYVVCLECGCKTYNLEQHLTSHGIDIEEYKRKHPNCTTSPSIKSKRIQGDSNPAYGHGGKYSSFSKKFVKYSGKTEEEIKEGIDSVKRKSSETKKLNPHNESTKIEYYLSRGMSMDEAKQALHDRQVTFSLEKLVAKYGEEEGNKRWKDRQDRWQATLNELPEEEKILISAKKGFWRYTDPKTDSMDHSEEETTFYVIRYRPQTGREYVKVGVTNRNLSSRFPIISVVEEIYTHKGTRCQNYHIERDVKRFIFENNLSILVESEDRKFDGWTECVDIKNKDLIMEAVHEAIRENTSKV